MFTRLRRLVVFLACADAVGTQTALLAANAIRYLLPLGQPLGGEIAPLNFAVHLLAALVFPVTFFSLSVYDMRRERPVGDPVRLTRAVMVATFAFSGALYFSFREVSRLLVVYFFVLELAILAAIRLVTGGGLRVLRHQGRALSKVLLVGAGESAQRVVEVMRGQMGDTVEIVGCVDDAATQGPIGTRLLGRFADVPHLVRSLAVDDVILALPSDQYATAEKLAFDLLILPVRVRLVPDYLRLVVVQSSVETLGGVPLIGLREPRIDGLTWVSKRVFDVIMTTLLMVVSWPLMALIALAIKLDSPGPVIFKQQRVGENGRLFWMYKFRTMVANAESLTAEVELDAQGRPIYKKPDDKRITRLGHFLRRTSLDELPQFFNIIKGEMSLVGPRPELLWIVEKYEPWQRQRLAMPPGLTGWWQINGRSDLPLHLNTQFDLYYVRNYSMWLDVQILLKTVWVVFKRQGAY